MRQSCRHIWYASLLLIAGRSSGYAVAGAVAQANTLQISADAADGSYTIGASGLTAPVLRARAAARIDGKWLRAADYPQHVVSKSNAAGELGSAEEWTIRYSGSQNAPEILIRLRAYAGLPFGEAQVTVRNSTSHPINVEAIRVLDADGTKLLDLGAPASADRVLSDSFSEDRPGMQLHDLTDAENQLHRAVGSQLIYNRQSHKSWFIGALTSDKFLSVLRLHMAGKGSAQIVSYEVESTGTTELLKENSLQESSPEDQIELSLPLAPGAELSSERMFFSIADDYHQQLETYGNLIRKLHHARVSAPTPLGWWSWTAYYFGLNEDTALTNAQWLSQHLKPLGYDFFHMDEGYQFARGEYGTPDATLFPNGVAALENKVIGEGLMPGIWTAPFEVSERSWIYTHHPDWLVHNAKGEPIHIGFVTEGKDHLYALDTTNPDAQAYLRHTYSTLVNTWGIRYFKLDFMEDSAVEGFYHQPHTTALEAQRIGLKTIRDAVGDHVLLDKDGSEMLNPVGIVDVGRISQDTGHTFSSSKDAAPGVAARYYMNRNYFIADPDAFGVSSQTVDDQHWHGGERALTLDEAKVSIALSAVSGGMFEIGDDLPTLGEAADRVALVENRDLIDMALLGRASIPLDLMSYQPEDLQPSIFLVKEDARQAILSIFNWSETARSHTLSRAALGLDANADYAFTEILTPGDHAHSLAAALDVQQPPHSVRMFKLVNIKIPATAPMVTADVPSSGSAGEKLLFHAQPASEKEPVLHYEWNFGDGIAVAGQNTTHAYTHAGTYDVHVRATGLSQTTGDQTFHITITGAVATRFMPEKKQRYVAPQP